MSSSKKIGFRRQNTGNGDNLSSTLQETVLKMPIRYSLSSIKEESKVANHCAEYTNVTLTQNPLQKTHTIITADKSIDSEFIDTKTRLLFSNPKADHSNKGKENVQFNSTKITEQDNHQLLEALSNDC